jgi:poly(3-hydroxybutyrate) depolymerase
MGLGHNARVGRGDAGLEHGTLDVAGVRRGYWLARGPGEAGTLLVALHGSGTSGRHMATFTGLATGPAAGVTAVFPDGWGGVWHIARPPPGSPALDDAAFLAALVERLSATSVFLAGLSNGGGFAEHVARHGLLPRWPGGPQFLPARAIGPIPRHLDATGTLLEMVTAGPENS